MCSVSVAFAGLAVVLLGDFLRLPPVRGKPIYACVDEHDKIERFLSLNLWHMFQFAELTEVMRQKCDAEYINLLNKIRIGDIDADVQQKLKARFVNETADNYPQNVVDMFEENYPAVVHNKKILDTLPGELCRVNATDNIPADCKYPLQCIASGQNRKQTDTGGLAKSLELKVGAKVMITVNIDIKDRLINFQVGEVFEFKIVDNVINKVYIKFQDPQIGRKAMMSNDFTKTNCVVPIEKCEADIPISNGSVSPSIKWTQFPLALSCACTIHKVQGLSLNEGVVRFDSQKQKYFGLGQIYTALSRVTNYDKLFCKGELSTSSIRVNSSALEEYQRLRQGSIFDTIEKVAIGEDTTTLLPLNVLSLLKYVHDVVSDNRLINNDIFCFTETHIEPHYSTNTIQSFFKNFGIYFNNNSNKFLSLVYGLHNNLELIDGEDFPGLSVINIVKSSYSKVPLKLMILYKPNSQPLAIFNDYLQYMIEAKGPDITVGDFNIDPYQEYRLSHLLESYSKFVDSPTHIAGSTLGHVYVKNELQENNDISVSVLNIYFSDYDAVRVQILKK